VISEGLTGKWLRIKNSVGTRQTDETLLASKLLVYWRALFIAAN